MRVAGIHIFTTTEVIRDGNNPPRRMPKGTKVFITGRLNGYQITRVNPIISNSRQLNSVAGVHSKQLQYHDQVTADIIFRKSNNLLN